MTNAPTRIYVDADACPVKDEIYRVALRHGVPVSVVAGNFIRAPQDPLIERIAAGSGMVQSFGSHWWRWVSLP